MLKWELKFPLNDPLKYTLRDRQGIYVRPHHNESWSAMVGHWSVKLHAID